MNPIATSGSARVKGKSTTNDEAGGLIEDGDGVWYRTQSIRRISSSWFCSLLIDAGAIWSLLPSNHIMAVNHIRSPARERLVWCPERIRPVVILPGEREQAFGGNTMKLSSVGCHSSGRVPHGLFTDQSVIREREIASWMFECAEFAVS